ncbi:hypothetical protein I8935_05045 [Campylobacter coli]|uniref:Uncharacterized protein n=3 Tax=Campylobacter coli TaxID=195 RepID=A0A0Q2K1N7_CAMCO|nr:MULTISPECIES: hypothetical protein [Campylobacter]EAK3886884.1 hypothetical protein [Campylobacter hyointestinalis]EAK5659706.1 hypothetical protein [Campylobacter fetus]ECL3092239.1 hypothetical protein [Campylobacter jejuni]EIA57692.1 hypothetical protein cco115_01025 [Campylobacter coli 2692]EIA69753.1 hypothetical protein cco4_07251 [Campylobacter coli 7--1]EIA73283.1 hypothetical protein cco54_07880 [Campylobacter coli 1891]EIA76595.1 hypothetical protein cco5_02967 [Campylobacter co
MYEKKDLRVLKIIQKAREFGDGDLLNEALVNQLVNAEFKEIESKEREELIALLNSLIEAKDKALLSNP